MSLSDAFAKGEIVTLPREKMINLSEQLSHTVKQDEVIYLSIMLDTQSGDIALDLGQRPDAQVFECFNFFNDVGMLG